MNVTRLIMAPGRRSAVMCAAIVVAHIPGSSLADNVEPRAALEGMSIPLSSVASYHCHDVAWPVISCFRSSAERDTDAGRAGGRSSAATQYVVVYADEDYGGSTFAASVAYADLGTFGWNDRITSFKSLNGQHPKFWNDVDYGTPAWQWTAGAWVANVGSGANDRFSALRNVP